MPAFFSSLDCPFQDGFSIKNEGLKREDLETEGNKTSKKQGVLIGYRLPVIGFWVKNRDFRQSFAQVNSKKGGKIAKKDRKFAKMTRNDKKMTKIDPF